MSYYDLYVDGILLCTRITWDVWQDLADSFWQEVGIAASVVCQASVQPN
jgi:hypothetical protein